MVVLGRRSRRVCLALPLLRGPRRAPGTSPMSPPASWRPPRAGCRPEDRPRRLRRVPPGCPVCSRGARLRRPLLVRRGAGMCPPSSCRRPVSRGLRDREHRSLRAHRPPLVVRRLRLHLGLRLCRTRPTARDFRVHRVLGLRVRLRLQWAGIHLSSQVVRVGLVFRSRPVLRELLGLRVCHRLLAAVVHLSSRGVRVGLALRSRPVLRAHRKLLGLRVCRVLPARRSLLVLPVFHGPRLGLCITRKPCCPRPRRAAPACLRRRVPPPLPAPSEPRALPAPQAPLEPLAPLELLRALRSRCRRARCRPRLRVPCRPRARCLRLGSPRQGSLRPGSSRRVSPRRGSLCPGSRCRVSPRRGSLRPGSRCLVSPRRVSLRPGSRPRGSPRPGGPVSPRPTATPSRRSPPSGPGIRPSFATVRRTGRSSS